MNKGCTSIRLFCTSRDYFDSNVVLMFVRKMIISYTYNRNSHRTDAYTFSLRFYQPYESESTFSALPSLNCIS